jgi:hypothetical protein
VSGGVRCWQSVGRGVGRCWERCRQVLGVRRCQIEKIEQGFGLYDKCTWMPTSVKQHDIMGDSVTAVILDGSTSVAVPVHVRKYDVITCDK